MARESSSPTLASASGARGEASDEIRVILSVVECRECPACGRLARETATDISATDQELTKAGKLSYVRSLRAIVTGRLL